MAQATHPGGGSRPGDGARLLGLLARGSPVLKGGLPGQPVCSGCCLLSCCGVSGVVRRGPCPHRLGALWSFHGSGWALPIKPLRALQSQCSGREPCGSWAPHHLTRGHGWVSRGTGTPLPHVQPGKGLSVYNTTASRSQGPQFSRTSHVPCLRACRCYMRTRVSVCAHTRVHAYMHASTAADV